MDVRKTKLILSLSLVALTFAVFWPVLHNGFINFDDPGYVYENAHVTSGLSPANLRWAFTSLEMSNWHPLTWLSHMVDCQLFGVDPAFHHLSSLVLHALNVLLLFLLLSGLTGSLWRSALVAALFAVHPLHVESVAWVAERKDVLAATFWMLTMMAYARYARRPGRASYLAVVVLFALGLLAKPMLVTLPFVLLLLDYWPLARTGSGGEARPIGTLFLEKAPLFALAASSCAITLYAQRHGGAVSSVGSVPLGVRSVNALNSWVGYIGKMFWPGRLSIIYPLDRNAPLWQALPALAVLCLASWLVLRFGRKYRYLPVGWFWYLGTLVPVIGIVQVGLQSMADRYSYLPSIGLFIVVVWGGGELISRMPQRGRLASAAAAVVLLLLCAGTRERLADWKDSVSLFSQAITVTGNNLTAHNNLGTALADQGRIDEAIEQFRAVLAIDPLYAQAYYNLGNQYSRLNRLQEALSSYLEAAQLQPDNPLFLNNLAVALARTGRTQEAVAQFSHALAVNPDYTEAHYNLGIALQGEGRNAEAAGQFSEALRLEPGYRDAERRLAYLARQGAAPAAR